MKSRIKVLLSKRWLCGEDAVDLLTHLIESKVSNTDFIDLVRDCEVDFYVDGFELIYNYKIGHDVASGLPVEALDGAKATILNDQMIRVLSPQLSETFAPYGRRFVLESAEYRGIFEGWSDDALQVQWSAASFHIDTFLQLGYALAAYFKTSDIQTMADVINGPSTIVSHCDAGILKTRIAELEGENAKLKAASNTPDGFVFPYSTPELEVMRDLAIKHWVGYNPKTDKKPQQKNVGIELTTKMDWSLSSDGTASRQASPLATAIQPEQYRGKK